MKHFFKVALTAVITLIFLSCQQSESTEIATETVKSEITADSTQRRAAPEFYIIQERDHKKRVWVCDDEASDIFHLQNDCPVFMTCRVNATKRNVSLTRAIEEYGRYNCTTCSSEFNHIFDEEMIRK